MARNLGGVVAILLGFGVAMSMVVSLESYLIMLGFVAWHVVMYWMAKRTQAKLSA